MKLEFANSVIALLDNTPFEALVSTKAAANKVI